MNASDLLLISVGSAAAGIARRVAARPGVAIRSLVLDTDDAVLAGFPPSAGFSAYALGGKRFNGRGTGGVRSAGASALRDDAAGVQKAIGAPRLAVVLTCCGGGTSGAVPILLELLRGQGIATLTFATFPFAFEGDDRRQSAVSVLQSAESATDALTRIPLDTLAADLLETTPRQELFDCVADRIGDGLALLWTLLTHPGFLPFDAEHFRNLLQANAAKAAIPFFFAGATARGEGRAEAALEQLLANPLFREGGIDRLANASQLVVGVLAGDDLRLCELGTVMTALRTHCTALKECFLGTADEPGREATLSVVLMAFGAPAQEGARDALSPVPRRRAGKANRSGAAPLSIAKSRFTDVEPTLHNGEDLDIPTYLRRGLRLPR